MLENCWLLKLEKYAETGRQSQTENFFTTCFAWVLESSPELREPVLRHIFGMDAPDSLDFFTTDVRTQERNRSGKFPDLTVRVRGKAETRAFFGAIECKVDSGHDKEDKVLRYLEIPEDYGDGRVAYIHNRPLDPPQYSSRVWVTTWREIHETIVEQIEAGRVTQSALVNDFLKFMERTGMTGKVEAMRIRDFQYVKDARKFQEAAEGLIEATSRTIVGSCLVFELGSQERSALGDYYGRRFIHKPTKAKFGLYFHYDFGRGHLVAWLYLTDPGNDNAAAGVLYAQAKQNWKTCEWKPNTRVRRAFPGHAAEYLVDDGNFPETGKDQTEKLARWAIDRLREAGALPPADAAGDERRLPAGNSAPETA